jgi:hypothetical protein
MIADLHLSDSPPVARKQEPDWYEAMARPLKELSMISKILDHPPILCAGDIFDNWNSSAKLINFAIWHLPPNVYAIPGQHDLPNHNIGELDHSAFLTLVLAKAINSSIFPSSGPEVTIQTRHNILPVNLRICSFPYGIDPRPIRRSEERINVALVHKYYWHGRAKYRNGDFNRHVGRGPWDGYDVIVLGDNHIPFFVGDNKRKRIIWNCGSLMRLTSDQKDHRPRIGILQKYETKLFATSYKLDISEDVFSETSTEEEIDEPTEPSDETLDLITALQTTGGSIVDLADVVRKWLEVHPMKKDTKQIVLEAIQKGRR